MSDTEIISMIVKSLDRMEKKVDEMHGRFMNLPCQTHSIKIDTMWKDYEARERRQDKESESVNSKVFKIAFTSLSIAGAAIAVLAQYFKN